MKVTVPDAVSWLTEPVVSGTSVMVAACVGDVITGLSSVPTIVIVTGTVTTPPCWSSIWIV